MGARPELEVATNPVGVIGEGGGVSCVGTARIEAQESSWRGRKWLSHVRRASVYGRKRRILFFGEYAMMIEMLESRWFLSASVAGNCFNDVNLDGVRQSTEAALSGRRVYADANKNDKFDTGEKSVLSDSSGNYK